jgi:hypothetical protein
MLKELLFFLLCFILIILILVVFVSFELNYDDEDEEIIVHIPS